MTRFLDNHTGLTVIFCALILAGCILALNLACQPTMDAFDWREAPYRVQAGDSLWTISGDYCPEGVDRREWIAEVQELNGLEDSVVYPGQRLTVLVPGEEG